MDQQNELQDQSDELPFWPIYGTELVFVWTVSEVVMSLAARTPPELFDDILFYVSVNCASQSEYQSDRHLQRNLGEQRPEDVLTDLKRCSLVCLFWANRCREHMFSGKILDIYSYEDAEIFRRYVVRGCLRLTPVHQLIKHIWVRQNYSAPRDYDRKTSFLHLLYLPTIQRKLDSLSIEGPVPEGFNPVKLDTPHWGIPPCIVAPSSFLQKDVFLHHIHLPSFHHVAKYIRHFSCTSYIRFDEITWDGPTPTYSLLHASNKVACQRRPRFLLIWATGDCTNSVHVALTASMMNPNCPLHRLSDEERVWMIRFMTLLWGDKKDPYVHIGFTVSEHATTMKLNLFHLVFKEASASTDRSASALSVVGMHAYIYEYDKLPANFDALVNHARTHPTIRALVVLFDSFDRLQESTRPFVEVLTLAAETIELVFAYEKKEERKIEAVGVGPVTLEPNGRIDTWDEERSGYYQRPNMCLQMLQRQLQKKKWMSVH